MSSPSVGAAAPSGASAGAARAERLPQRGPRRYEEFARVISVNRRGRAVTSRGRDGTIVTAIGENRFTLLEMIGAEGATFEIGERICVDREQESKVTLVLGKVRYERLSDQARAQIRDTIEQIVDEYEDRFVEYYNKADHLTTKVHALDQFPGIGRAYTKTILEERARRKFDSFEDIAERTKLDDPRWCIVQRIDEEVTGKTRTCLFAKR